jgi:hypothetical protein
VQTVTIKDATPGAAIYYTTDGSTPTSKSALYTGPITVGASKSFWAIALAPGGSASPVGKAWYTILLPTATPVATPPGGTYSSIQQVTLTDATPGAVIYYTTNGIYPTTSSAVYSKPIPATTGTVIQAVALAPNYEGGSSMKAAYTIVAPAPKISPASGTLPNKATVTMSDAAAGATIHYTTDGSTPTAASATYTGPITVSPQGSATLVYQAIATASGYSPSPAATATFTVELPAGVLAEATVGTTPTMAIPPNFLGLSTDYHQPPLMMGDAATGVNEAYRTLLKNLTASATAPLPIRITGDDSKLSDIQADTAPLAQLAAAANVDYILGVDLWSGNVSLAQEETTAWLSGIPNDEILGFEIGNEPDVYPYNGARPSSYTFAQYLTQFQQWQKEVSATAGSGFAIMGTSMGAETNWVPSANAALASGALSATIVSQHSYLGGPTQPSGQPWPADYLLQPIAATKYPTAYASFAAAAHKAGRKFRMGEINSFYGGGAAGLSNSFSSALWSIDLMFNYLANGMDGVNWHSGQGTLYELYLFHAKTAGGVAGGSTTFTLTQVMPLYYGLLVFSEMAGRNAKALPTTVSTDANVAAHATVDDAGVAHVIVINKDEHAAGDVQITLPGYSTGTVRYLKAPSYTATTGVTWAGQTFDGSEDGTIQGTYMSTTITASDGVFTLRGMPITSAALIDFTP